MPRNFGGWLQRLAINEWLQVCRGDEALKGAGGGGRIERSPGDVTSIAMDLDRALAMLPGTTRLCIVLSCYARLSKAEITAATGMPPGTVKSHIRRGRERLRDILSDYPVPADAERVQ